jgi:DUF4097 and DUF4098 domain-containing protein YvlB
MKKLFLPIFSGLALSCTLLSANAQEFIEHISKEFVPTKDASATVLSIYNVDGPIRVEGYSGNKIVIEIDKRLTAEDSNNLETGKKEFRLEFAQTADTITAYIAEPQDSRPHNKWHQRDGRYIQYRYHLNFVVKVPFGINLNISTVNNGDITVKDVAGTLHVNNVNGAIFVANAKGITQAHTVNGKIDVSYLSSPPGYSSYYTVNGEISVTYPISLSGDFQFKSLNGEFFTDFQNAEVLPAKVVKTQEQEGGATTYKLNKLTSMRIGAGESSFRFETVNGNIYIKKQS